MNGNVSIGPSSLIGWAASAGSELVAFAGWNPAGISRLSLTILGVAALTVTNLGRQLQAYGAARAGGEPEPVVPPTDEEELASPPPQG